MKYYYENAEKINSWHRNYRVKNIEKARLAGRLNYEKHKPKRLEKVKEYRVNNKDLCSQRALIWRKANPEKRKASEHKRRALKAKSLGGSFTGVEWKAVLSKYKNRCFECGSNGKLSVGHLIPLSKGGSNHISNVAPQCLPCNFRQSTKIHPLAKPSLFDRLTE